jgi:hypothetical protein
VEHIVSLLSQPEQSRLMGERGRRLVNEKFSSQKQLQNIENLYNELLGPAKPREVLSFKQCP